MKQLIGLLLLGLLVVSACTVQPGLPPETQPETKYGVETPTGSGAESMATQELKKFSSKEELKTYLESNQGSNYYGSFARSSLGAEVMVLESADMADGAAIKMAAPSGGADEFSTTNVQVQGVDEADFVKNDDQYIYMLSGDNLVIVDAYPAADAEILSKTDIDGRPRDMFIYNEKLVVFVDRNDYVTTIGQFDIMPRKRYMNQLYMVVYDISDRENPEVEEEFTMAGNYLQSRMIDGYIYFLVRDDVRMYDYYPEVPMIRGGATSIEPEIYYFDNPENNYQFTTVASLDLNNLDIEAKSYLMGYTSTIFVSLENLYVAYQKNFPYSWYEDEKERKFWEVVLPELPSKVRDKITAVRDDDLSAAEEWSRISEILEEMYNGMSESAKDDLVEEIEDALRQWEWDRDEERRKTVIHKIAIDEGKIDYVAKGEVKGQLLNQFSMDEFQGNLRVATTTYVYSRQGSTMWNNVYVLDEEMEQIGELEQLAEDERIYSTRFMGERLYMVTFKRVDPLFVIDLENPRRPLVLGELKIPGFSDYLHPMGEGYLIGVGKETKENEWGGVSLKGVKVALFDVTDVTDPKQVDVYEIGGPGSTTEVSQDHKAFLFDDEKDLMVLPIREVKESWDPDNRWRHYSQRVWQGAYVFTVDEDGFERRGKVSHYEGDEESRWYWGSPWAVRRSLFMDDVLYTISQKKIEMHDLEDVTEINDLDLPYSDYYRGGGIEPMPMMDVVME
jgi:inhibitor of cysteine peptidase